jgi:tetratricopeptide (TPR) repeat protein
VCASKQAPGDLDGALADINEAIRLNPALPSPLTNRAVIWRARGDLDRAISDTSEAIRLAKAHAPVDMDTIMAGLDDQVRTNILILDACRNSPMAPRVASAEPNRAVESGSGLAAPASLGAGSALGAGSLIAFATPPARSRSTAQAPTARSRPHSRATSARPASRCSRR